MFDLKVSAASSKSIALYTGLSPVQVVAINPTHEELKVITSNNSIPEQLAVYSKRTNQFTQTEEMPLTIWFKTSEGATFPYTLNMTDKKITSKNGKVKFINDYGKISAYVDNISSISDNPKMKWFSTSTVRELTGGEDDLFTLMKQLLRYDEGSSGWLEQMNANYLTGEKLFDGDRRAWSAIRGFFDMVKDNCVVMPLVVKSYNDANGTERFRQEVLFNQDLIFRTVTCSITDGMTDKFIAVDNTYQIRMDKPITNKYYTYIFQEFKKEDCISAAPATVVPQSWLV
jgi:hypothetical protein